MHPLNALFLIRIEDHKKYPSTDIYVSIHYHTYIPSTTSLIGNDVQISQVWNSTSLTIWPQPADISTTAHILQSKLADIRNRYFQSSISLNMWFFWLRIYLLLSWPSESSSIVPVEGSWSLWNWPNPTLGQWVIRSLLHVVRTHIPYLYYITERVSVQVVS